MDESELTELISKYRDGTCTQQEKALLEDWVAATTYPEYQISDQDLREDLAFISNSLPLVTRQMPLWPRIATVAAVTLLVMGAGLFYLTKNQFAKQTTTYNYDTAGVKQGVTITLASGKEIILADKADGGIAKETGISITKTADKRIVYNINGLDIKINALTTIKGEQCVVRLPDKTIVYLNSASTLKLPENFMTNATRNVELAGEAYFEVTKDQKHPFIVASRKQKVEVLGTRFNINAYPDEPDVETTLLEGSVKITEITGVKLLKPGEQAINADSSVRVLKIDTTGVTGWKDGKLMFNGDYLETVMRKISRCYNVEIVYDSTFSVKAKTLISGEFLEKAKLQTVLDILTLVCREREAQLSFKIQDNKVLVSRNSIK